MTPLETLLGTFEESGRILLNAIKCQSLNRSDAETYKNKFRLQLDKFLIFHVFICVKMEPLCNFFSKRVELRNYNHRRSTLHQQVAAAHVII